MSVSRVTSRPDLPQRVGHLVAGAHDVADLLRGHLDIGSHQLDVGRREERLDGDVRVVDGLHPIGDVASADGRDGAHGGGALARGRRDVEGHLLLLADDGDLEGHRGGRDLPAGGRVEAERPGGVGDIGANGDVDLAHRGSREEGDGFREIDGDRRHDHQGRSRSPSARLA